jgi:hypothetical protein
VRLIAKVFHAARSHVASAGGILDHLGLSPPEASKPPPAMPEVVRVPVDEEGREVQAP